MKKKIIFTLTAIVLTITGYQFIQSRQKKNWNLFFSTEHNIFLNPSGFTQIDFFLSYYDFFDELGQKKETSEVWKYHACVFKDDILNKNKYLLSFNQKQLSNLIDSSCQKSAYTFENKKMYVQFWWLCENKNSCEYILLKTDTHFLTEKKSVYKIEPNHHLTKVDFDEYLQNNLKTDAKINPVFVGFSETGLGNNLFQYWSAFAYAHKWNKKLVPLNHRPILDIFSNLAQVPEDIEKLDLNNFRFILMKRHMDFESNQLIIAQNALRYENLIGIEDFIRKNSKFSKQPSALNQKFIRQLDKENAVAVHIRRGDFISQKMPLLSFSYYENALNYIKESIKKPHLYIFSDDIQWVKENFKPNADYTFVDWNKTDYEDLQLMTYFKNFIIANSTFSWWGAFLSTEKNKIVLTPKHGFYREEKPDRPLEKGWILIPEE